MAKLMKRIVLMLWVIALCVGALSLAVCAANDPISATIEVNTALSGHLPDTPDTFLVVLTPDQADAPMPAGSKDGAFTLSLEGSASGTISIPFDQVGTYAYTVRQLPAPHANCLRDAGVYHITACVTGGQEQGLFLSVVLSREDTTGKQDDITFGNHYAIPAQLTLTAIKTLDQKTPKDEAFSFALKDSKGNTLQTVCNDGRDVTFAPISYSAAGTYTYSISEVAGKDAAILYDKTVYTAVVTVEQDENSDYQAKVVYRLGDKPLTGAPAFANKTKPITPQTGDNANPGLWIALLLISGGAMAALLFFSRRKDNEEEAPQETPIPQADPANE